MSGEEDQFKNGFHCAAYRYLGADDQAGPNYTGRAAVNSHCAPNAWHTEIVQVQSIWT